MGRNVLRRINRELSGTIPIDAFRHLAMWNENEERTEMHLEATRDIQFKVGPDRFVVMAGETIHTENGHKYGTGHETPACLYGPAAGHPSSNGKIPTDCSRSFLRRKAPALRAESKPKSTATRSPTR